MLKNGIAYLARGNAKESLGDLTGTCNDWRKAASLGEENGAIWVSQQCN